MILHVLNTCITFILKTGFINATIFMHPHYAYSTNNLSFQIPLQIGQVYCFLSRLLCLFPKIFFLLFSFQFDFFCLGLIWLLLVLFFSSWTYFIFLLHMSTSNDFRFFSTSNGKIKLIWGLLKLKKHCYTQMIC